MYLNIMRALLNKNQPDDEATPFVFFHIIMADSLAKLTTFDAYAKTLDDFKIKTNTGALISISSVFIAVLLVISEFIEYSRPSMRPELVVDQARQDRLPIYVNLTFPRMPCNCIKGGYSCMELMI